MNRTSSQFKQMARGTLNGRYGTPMGATVIMMLIGVFLNMICSFLFGNYFLIDSASRHITFNTSRLVFYYVFYLVITLLMAILSAGAIKLYLNMCRNQNYKIGDIFYAFSHHPDRIIVAAFLIFLINMIAEIPMFVCMAWFKLDNYNLTALFLMFIFTLLGIVLSFWITLRYSLVYYLLVDHIEMGAIEALKESAHIMKGNKGRLLYLILSFIGLSLLCILTCGIGSLWVLPYRSVTLSYFYLEVIGELGHSHEEIVAEAMIQEPIEDQHV